MSQSFCYHDVTVILLGHIVESFALQGRLCCEICDKWTEESDQTSDYKECDTAAPFLGTIALVFKPSLHDLVNGLLNMFSLLHD